MGCKMSSLIPQPTGFPEIKSNEKIIPYNYIAKQYNGNLYIRKKINENGFNVRVRIISAKDAPTPYISSIVYKVTPDGTIIQSKVESTIDLMFHIDELRKDALKHLE